VQHTYLPAAAKQQVRCHNSGWLF